MAMMRAAKQAIQTLGYRVPSSSTLSRNLHASPRGKKIVGVFYKANEYASMNPNFVGVLRGLLVSVSSWNLKSTST